MLESGKYKGAMTLDEFKEIVRELQSQKPVRTDPFEYIKYSPTIQKALNEAFSEQIEQ